MRNSQLSTSEVSFIPTSMGIFPHTLLLHVAYFVFFFSFFHLFSFFTVLRTTFLYQNETNIADIWANFFLVNLNLMTLLNSNTRVKSIVGLWKIKIWQQNKAPKPIRLFDTTKRASWMCLKYHQNRRRNMSHLVSTRTLCCAWERLLPFKRNDYLRYPSILMEKLRIHATHFAAL